MPWSLRAWLKTFQTSKNTVSGNSIQNYCKTIQQANRCSEIDTIWNIEFDQFQSACLSPYCIARWIALVLTVSGQANLADGKKQDFIVAQPAKENSATVSFPNRKVELPVDCKDVEMFSMPVAPHDKDIMSKVW